MKSVLAFIIPVRHQDNARDWRRVKEILTQTVRSVAAQEGEGWKAVIVANHGADLPPLPRGVEVKWVDFAPNALHEKDNLEKVRKGKFWRAFRLSKGRRVLAGMLHAGDVGHFMIVDDDDFVSRKLTSFVAHNSNSNGWVIRDGYVWSEGSRFLFSHPDFSALCGSSHIVRADLYKLPPSLDEASEFFITRVLASHRFTRRYFDRKGTPLAPLPFPGAIYRVGNTQSHSRVPAIAEPLGGSLGQPVDYIGRAIQPHALTEDLRAEFFGE
ncbi:hypothetical protein HNQ77_004827 [Silvibacterium bohemicum]|uniref:Galactosyl transferase n=1 Tax=Silvibacterium bohemicum TaxID=1577686 RepID=A0A841JZU4_9BACT|nr:hypothetical protein [Silvibacterium bohemicum]MBB6146846.1 hypothetical protein [Silvibacterium bohemicum]